MKRTIAIALAGILIVPPLVAIVKIALLTNPGIDDCVQTYAKELKEGRTSSGFIYSLSGGMSVATHIDTQVLPLPVKGKSYGCINVTDDKFADYFNTVYCGVAYFVTEGKGE